MKKYLSLVLVFVFLFSAQLAEAVNVSSILQLSANTHAARQGTYQNGTTGGTDQNVWEWEIGSGTTFTNIQGISAVGILGAYNRTLNPAYLQAAIGTANTLKNRYNNNAPTRPFAQDVAFFANLCSASGDNSWCTLASTLYARVTNDFPTGAANADRYIAARGSLAGWDVSWHIRAAMLTGNTTYALDMANRLFAQRPVWEGVLLGGFDYTVISHNAMLWAYAPIPTLKTKTTTLRSLVLGSQGANGSWGNGDFQTTAYGLMAVASGTSTQERAATNAAATFFINTATPAGGWQYVGEPENGEVNSEIISALSLVNDVSDNGLGSPPAFQTYGSASHSAAVPAN